MADQQPPSTKPSDKPSPDVAQPHPQDPSKAPSTQTPGQRTTIQK